MNKKQDRLAFKICWSIALVTIQIVFLSSVSFGQDNTVTGTVTDAQSGETLPGVNVIVKGTTTGTSTGSEGNYELSVPSLQDTLVFSFIGYQTQEVPINGRTEINVELQPQAIQGEEMVVVGYGQQRREDVTGSIASVSMEDVRDVPVTGFNQALTGKLAGVQVNTVSGVPGGGPKIRIRGVGSIGAGNDPLFVIDGFPISDSPGQRTNPLNSIPPSQIASIEVLKDASATAIYGSRGANGVILVTTKKGTSQTQIQLNSFIGLQSVRKRGMVDVLNARQFARFKKERISDNIRFNEGREPTEQDIPEMYRNPEEYGEGTDWVDEIFQPAIMHSQNLSISGGNKKIQAIVSANFLDQRGALLETGYRRYGLRINLDAKLSEKLSVGMQFAPSLENQKLADTDGSRTGAVGSAYLINPIVPVKNADGSLAPMVDGPGLLAFVNPVLKLKEVDHTLRRGRAIVNTFAEYELVEGLILKSSFNVDWRDRREKRFEPTTVGEAFNRYPPTEAVGLYNTVKTLNWLNENTLNYQADFGLDHSVDALLGFTVQKETIEAGNFNARGFPDNEIETFNAASTISGNTNITEWGLVSLLARVNYDYKNKYLLTTTIRRDGSSRFGAKNKWGTFPSFSVGWRISDEPFMNEVEQINNVLLRAGYGLSGNFNIGNYAHLGTISTTDYALNSQQVAGRSITNLGNPNLGWEEVKQLNVGLDLGMFQDRLNITVDYYHKVTSNMLLNVETPFTSGFNSALVNRGEVTNKGIELGVNSTIIRNSSWDWGINFNISHNSNKVTELDSPILSPASTAQHITEEGYPVGQFYGFQVIGFFEDQDEIDNAPLHPGAIPGSYRHRDVNGDGRIDPVLDFTRIGSPYPDFTWGLTNSLQYKNVDFSISMTGSHGGETLQTGREDFWNLDGVFNVSTEALNRWRSPENPGDGKVPRAISNVIHRYNQSTWVESSSNIWIRDITVGYTFNTGQYGILHSVGAQNLRLYMNVHNAWISNTNFQNPAVSLNASNPLQPGETRNTNYPISRIFTLGVNINF